MAPVSVGVHSTTYSRFIDGCVAPGRRPRAATAKSRASPEPAGPPRQEVGVERDDHVGLVEVVDRLDVLAEGQPRTLRGRRRASTGS